MSEDMPGLGLLVGFAYFGQIIFIALLTLLVWGFWELVFRFFGIQ